MANNKFANVCDLTVHIYGKVKDGVRAFLSMGKDENGDYLPSLWLTLKGKDAAVVKTLAAFDKGVLVTVDGRFAYEEFERKDGKDGQTSKGESLSILVDKVQAFDEKFHNWVKLAVRIGRDGEARFTAEGRMWAKARGFVSMGKDDKGNYKQPWHVTLKAFTDKTTGDTALPEALGALVKGQWATVEGKLAYEEYAKKENPANRVRAGGTGREYQIVATSIAPIMVATATIGDQAESDDPPAEPEPAAEGEPD